MFWLLYSYSVRKYAYYIVYVVIQRVKVRIMSVVEEMEGLVGESLKALRLSRNIGQQLLAERAGVSTRALQSLENGEGSTLSTFVKIMRALGREDWFKTLAPVATVNPMTVVRKAAPRQRARNTRAVRKPGHE